MSYLARIDRKLNELVKAKEAGEAEKEPTQEEKDEERLREIEERIEDLTELLSRGVTRHSADDQVHDHKERVKSGKGEPRPLLRVFHDHGGKRIATTRRTQAWLFAALERFTAFLKFGALFFAWAYIYLLLAFLFFWHSQDDARRPGRAR